jgi:hypothetical protein
MNQQEYEQLRTNTVERKVLGLVDLVNRTPRTLIYGYNIDREDFHVYIGADNLIHILLYSERDGAKEGEPKYYELHHRFGECGGAEENTDFVPSKRVYPESCDYEFCQVLKRYGVNIPFTTFTEGADERRKAECKGYAGLTHEDGGIELVYLHPQLAEDPEFPKESISYSDSHVLTTRLVSQAARDLRAASVTSMDGSYVRVAKHDAERVLAKAREFMSQLRKTTVFASYLAETLATEAFDSFMSPRIDEQRGSGGELTVRIDAKHLKFRSGKGLTAYVGTPEGYWEGAVVGTYEGRPFIAGKMKHGEAEIIYSQFGSTERFIEKYLKMYGLTQATTEEAPVPAPAKAASAPTKAKTRKRKPASA